MDHDKGITDQIALMSTDLSDQDPILKYKIPEGLLLELERTRANYDKIKEEMARLANKKEKQAEKVPKEPGLKDRPAPSRKRKPNHGPTIYWTHNWYQNDQGEPVKLSYAANLKASEQLAQSFLNEPVLGFDMEWRMAWGRQLTGIKDNISLIQLAKDGEVGLFHIAQHAGRSTPQLFAPSLLKIIQDPGIAKVGVAIQQADALQLRKFAGIKARGLFELSYLHRLVLYSETEPVQCNKTSVGLSHQVETHLDFPLHKGKVRTSNWAKPLDDEQCNYAAADAYAGFVLYHVMNTKRRRLYPTPPLPELAELGRPIILANGEPAPKPPPKVKKTRPPEAKATPATEADKDSVHSSSTAFEDPIIADVQGTIAASKSRPVFKVPPGAEVVVGNEIAHFDTKLAETDSQLDRISNTVSSPRRKHGKASNRPQHESELKPSTAAPLPPGKPASIDQPKSSPRRGNTSPQKQLKSALVALQLRLSTISTTTEPSVITDKTLSSIAATRPKGITDLCRIPGAVHFYHYARGHGVDLFDFVRQHGGIS